MSECTNRLTLFHELRRERGLFALVGTVLVLFNLFQPLALVGQAQLGGRVICYGMAATEGADKAPGVPRRDCPACLSGLCVSASVPAKALPPPLSAFAAPVSDAAAVRHVRNRPILSARCGPPPAIRAPPFVA